MATHFDGFSYALVRKGRNWFNQSGRRKRSKRVVRDGCMDNVRPKEAKESREEGVEVSTLPRDTAAIFIQPFRRKPLGQRSDPIFLLVVSSWSEFVPQRPLCFQRHKSLTETNKPHELQQQQPLFQHRMAITFGDIPRLICSVIIPPVGVFFQVGCNKDLAINILLTLLGYIPGLIHAVYILVRE